VIFILYSFSLLVVFITYLLVVIDMFKKKVSRGFCGLFFFPLTYYHSIKYYSGNKKVVATLLWTATLIVISMYLVLTSNARNELKQFNENVAAQLNVNCKTRNDVIFGNNGRIYLTICTPARTDDAPYKDVGDMVKGYQIKLIEPMLPIYKNTIRLDTDKTVIIGINTPFNVYACFEINNTGVVIDSWNTDQKKPCDIQVRRKRD